MNGERLNSRQIEMFSTIETWKASGQSQHFFCKEQGMVYSNFHYWYKKYKNQQQGESNNEAFLPVKVKKTMPPCLGNVVMELELGNGARLKFYQTVEASYLRSLLV